MMYLASLDIAERIPHYALKSAPFGAPYPFFYSTDKAVFSYNSLEKKLSTSTAIVFPE